MAHSRRIPIWLWRWMHRLNRRISGGYRRGARLGRLVLLLTTTGRKTGLPRTTPVQYEIVDGAIYVASARGQEADWFRNIVANPRVRVQIKDEQFEALAEPITDPTRVADLLELRLKRHPVMIRLMLLAEGLPLRFNRTALETFAADKAVVAIRMPQVPATPGKTSVDAQEAT
ncbi:MAG TPA: nitroreductase/quinone reductase family protein [Anaerolineae bacterium]|nr:nitroreductase/quinone reductase family protein [Anaerolineae bacterium]